MDWICNRLSNPVLNKWSDIFALSYIFVATIIFVQKTVKSLSNSKLNKLNLKNGEIELKENKEDTSVFNKHMDEIVYFFEVTDYNVVIIEDLDRFDNTDIFLKLREVNQLLNQSNSVGRKVTFIYAVKDDMFFDEERTKFFDYITTVIPIINSSNSADKLKEELEIKGYSDLNVEVIDSLAFFIDDMRLLKNIENNKNKKFVTRLQPKYYFKFQKSLEHNEHGVISSLIIYKLLLFFLESDYSINEDYMFCYEDTRQFYIRREILRSIASHTCHDIYQMDIFKFSFLLIICDDAQEWGRKSISELYVNKSNKYSFGSIDLDLQGDVSNSCLFRDNQELNDTSQLKILLRNFYKQSETYRSVFRDGQDTVKRNFNFTRQWGIIWSDSDGNISYIVKLDVSQDEQTKLTIKRTDEAKISTSDVLLSSFNKFLEDIGGDGFVLETDKKSAVFYLK